MLFGIRFGGGNGDSNSKINGVVGLEGICFGPCLSDYNDDGLVNTLDVLAFLNAWSSAC